MTLIPPQLHARLRGLRLSTRRQPGGHGVGRHASRARGAGLEFAQYRGYEPGDDPRRIDWKLHARSDRWYVRDTERDSPLTAWLLLDATASMQQADRARPRHRKLDAARVLAACVAELAVRHGDRIGLATLGASGSLLAAGGGARHRDRLWLELARLTAQGRWPAEARVRALCSRIAADDLVVFIGDGFEPAATGLAEQLARARRDVVHLQLLSADERDFPFEGDPRFVDPESGERRQAEAVAVREDYLAAFGAAQAALAQRLAAAGVRHAVHWLDAPPERVLQALFA